MAPVLFSGCRDRGLEQRTEQIRELSTRQDRMYTAEAISHVQRNYWTMRDRSWFGKLAEGDIVRLHEPRATTAALPSRAFYRGWHLQLTISSDDWRVDPKAPHEGHFEVVYAITRHSAVSWDIRVIKGPVTAPLHREDAGRMAGLE
jgi:hypothetical protein